MDPVTANDLLAEGTLPQAWARRWHERPEDPALADAGRGWLTNQELDQLTARRAAGLRRRGLVSGDRVVVSGPTGSEVVITHVAALRAGLTVVPVNPALTRAERDAVLDAAQPRAVLSPGVSTGTIDPATDPAIELDAAAPDDVALLAFTSGTTGRPKGVGLTHANLLAGAEALRRAWAWNPEDRLLLALPLFHMHGLGVGIHGTLLAGASVLLFERFDPEAILAAAARPESTLFFGVPTMYDRLVDAPGVERLANLRLCVSGSAPLRADLHRRIEAATGQRVLERYGMTETVMLTSNPLDPADGDRRPGTVGRPLPGVDLRLDPDTDEIQVRGPNVFRGYVVPDDAAPDPNQTDPNELAFTEDGWFRTGDIGRLDPDGYLSIVARAKDLIITGGYNVYPAEIEVVLRDCPGVREAAVAGIPDERWGETVGAWLEVDPTGDQVDGELDLDAVRAWCADRLAPYKQPRRVTVVDALPRNALGKVQRQLLS